MKRLTIAVSGGFDPVHFGHVKMIESAADYGDVIVILNSDAWLLRKKGFVFMPWGERAAILRAFKCVKRVVAVDDEDGTVCKALRLVEPDFFANGGDRTLKNSVSKEGKLCEQLGIKRLYGIGGMKIQSSSELVKKGNHESIKK